MQEEKEEQAFEVTPWQVSGEVDYDKLVKQFGVSLIDGQLMKRIEKLAGSHFMLRRGLFFAHRDLPWLLARYETGEKFFLYTGRGPSGKTHIGHLVPWIFTRWLQEKFNVEVWFQLTDDEKFLFSDNMERPEQANELAYENVLDFLALGFEPGKTFVFSNLDYAKTLYRQAIRVAKKVTFSTVKAVFGFNNENNIGQIFFTSMQAVPAFLPSVLAGKNIPCLIPHGIDQDPHFRIARDVLPKLGYYKPASIQCKFLPGLTATAKMSSSKPGDAIFTTDTAEEIAMKVKKYAFSGGQPTIQEHREKGGNPDIDMCFIWLKYLFEPDEKKLEQIYWDYKTGKMLTSELKEIFIEKATSFLRKHQEAREKARKELDKFVLKD